MRSLILFGLLLVCACAPVTPETIAPQRSDLVGSWYGIYSRGRFTVLFDSEFRADGHIETRYTTCLSDVEQELRKRSGSWHYADNIFTLTYEDADEDGNPRTPFVASYRITMVTPERVRYESMQDGTRFWKARKWTRRHYNCATTRALIDADRHDARDRKPTNSVMLPTAENS